MDLELDIETRIAAPPAAVWAAMTDTDAWTEWMMGLVRIDMLTDGPMAEGSRWREVRKIFGKEAAEVFEVTAFEPGQRFDLYVDGSQGATGSGEYRFQQVLHPDGDGTRLHVHGVITVEGGFLKRMMGKLMVGPMKASMTKDFESLKAHVEAKQG